MVPEEFPTKVRPSLRPSLHAFVLPFLASMHARTHGLVRLVESNPCPVNLHTRPPLSILDQLGTVPPEPQLFNFLVPGRDEKPFYGACLLMYRPASEALPIDDDDVEVRFLKCV